MKVGYLEVGTSGEENGLVNVEGVEEVDQLEVGAVLVHVEVLQVLKQGGSGGPGQIRLDLDR